MSDLRNLPNIGKVAEALLIEAGIDSSDKLRKIGSKEAFLRIRLKDQTACLHMLYGLEGAVRGIRDTELPTQIKHELNNFYKSL